MRALRRLSWRSFDTDADFGGTSFGKAGWQSTIDMPNGTRLTLADLLMLKWRRALPCCSSVTAAPPAPA